MAAVLGERSRSLAERLREAVFVAQPAPTPARRVTATTKAVARAADDKERLVGLFAAPLAGAIGILIITALLANDPPALLTGGRADRLHVNPAVYHELFYVLVALSVAMLATALLRRRLFLGMAMAMYGLALFNLHYWGFGVPFLMAGSWLLVRAYRANRDHRDATTGSRQSAGGRARR